MNPGQVVDPVKANNINVLVTPAHPYVKSFDVKESKYISFTTMVNSESPKELDKKNREKQYFEGIKKVQEEKRLQKLHEEELLKQKREEEKRLLEEKKKQLLVAEKKLQAQQQAKQVTKSKQVAQVPSRGGGSNVDNLVSYVSNYTDPNSARLYVDLSIQYGKQYNIDAVWLLAIMKTESNFNPNVVSSAGAIGLMQFLPGTAKYLGVAPSQLSNPSTSISLSARYLNDLRNQTGSLKMATIAYNQGIGNVQRGTYKTWYYSKVSNSYQDLKASIR